MQQLNTAISLKPQNMGRGNIVEYSNAIVVYTNADELLTS